MMMNRLYFRVISLALVILLFSACAPQPPVPEDNYYRLPTPVMQPVSRTLAHTLYVNRFVTDGLHTERALLYCNLDTPTQLRQYHYHHWIDSPPRLIQEHLISALRSAHAADQVINYDPANRDGYLLNGKIRSFEHRLSGNKATILLDMELRLDNASHKLVFVHDYRLELDANSSQPGDLVASYDQALQKLYGMFLADWQATQH